MPDHLPNRPKRAIFAGLARNCAAWLPRVLANVEMMAKAFEQSAFLFLENDSFDNSRAILERWCAGRPRAVLLTPDDPAAFGRVRTVRLAALRNQIIAEARRRHPDFDVLVLLDCDDVCATPQDPQAFARALDFLWQSEERATVFANSPGHYYDMWAFRHPAHCPFDIWEATMDHSIRHHTSRAAAFDAVYAPRIFAMPIGAPPLEVDSAFGALGIYRLSRVLANRARYDGSKIRTIETEAGPKQMGWQMCEHVSFHAGLRADGGRLFVLPWLSIGFMEEVTLTKDWEFILFDPADLDAPPVLVAPPTAEIGRNQPCPCGSGQRYKNCHGLIVG